jgi:hypothetical protein
MRGRRSDAARSTVDLPDLRSLTQQQSNKKCFFRHLVGVDQKACKRQIGQNKKRYRLLKQVGACKAVINGSTERMLALFKV